MPYNFKIGSYTAYPTYNFRPMWVAAGFTPYDNAGKTGKQVAKVLIPAIAAMEAEPAKFIALEPPNGWGKYEHGVFALKELLRECQAHPRAIFMC